MTGSETGHEAAVPYVHYFEGMLSLGPYRVPDAGRDMQRILDDVPEQVAKFQTGHFYRLPLWELVYHDCVVAQWYWGDYNNKLPQSGTAATCSTPSTARRRCSCSTASSGRSGNRSGSSRSYRHGRAGRPGHRLRGNALPSLADAPTTPCRRRGSPTA